MTIKATWDLWEVRLPLHAPFTNAGGTTQARELALVAMSKGGVTGWGEIAPFPGQDPPLAEVVASRTAQTPHPLMAAGVDQARHDWDARIRQVSLVDDIGGVRRNLPVSLAVGIGDAAMAAVSDGVDEGVKRFKVKIAPGRLGHVVDIRARWPEIGLGVDANGSFGDDTVGQLRELNGLGLAYMEQPGAPSDADTTSVARSHLDVPTFVDESVRTVADVAAIGAAGIADGIVIKPGRLGLSGALHAVDIARGSGLMWRASGLLETSVGRSFTNALATLEDASVSDVAPATWFLAADVGPAQIHRGEIILPSAAGIGFEPSMDIIDDHLMRRRDITEDLS